MAAPTTPAASCAVVRIMALFTKLIITTADFEHAATHHASRNFAPRISIETLNRGTRDTHNLGALRLIHMLVVDKPDGFIFFKTH